MSASKKAGAAAGAGGRQSNLLSFFQKTPKRADEEPAAETKKKTEAEKKAKEEAKDDEDILVEQVAERENNLPGSASSSRTSPRKIAAGEDKKKPMTTPTTTTTTPLANRGHRQSQPAAAAVAQTPPAAAVHRCSTVATTIGLPVILDSDDDDENSRGVGFLSCASSSSAPASKRRRVIMSSDEDEEKEQEDQQEQKKKTEKKQSQQQQMETPQQRGRKVPEKRRTAAESKAKSLVKKEVEEEKVEEMRISEESPEPEDDEKMEEEMEEQLEEKLPPQKGKEAKIASIFNRSSLSAKRTLKKSSREEKKEEKEGEEVEAGSAMDIGEEEEGGDDDNDNDKDDNDEEEEEGAQASTKAKKTKATPGGGGGKKKSKPPTAATTSTTASNRPPKLNQSTHSFIESFGFAENAESRSPSPAAGLQDERRAAKKSAAAARERRESPPAPGEHFPHLDFDFLKPAKLKDARGRRPTDEDYDAGSLHVPDKFLSEQSPGHQQWWRLKAAHFDTILFFKVGKFYELYHMDAVAAVECLGLTYMRGKYAHCGFPEGGYGRFADLLVQRGYKVARVEQTETPEQLAARQKQQQAKAKEREKVVRREICRVTTQATRTYGVQDGSDQREVDGTAEPNASYLMALVEEAPQHPNAPVHFGLCFVDCATGRFRLSEFDDDRSQSNLRTLLAHNYPAQLIHEKGTLSASTGALLNTMLANVPREALPAKRRLRTAEETLATLCDDNYFGPNLAVWPRAIREMLANRHEQEQEGSGVAIPEPSKHRRMCLAALGAVIWYLQQCLIDVDMISMRQFEQYSPPSVHSDKNEQAGEGANDNGMLLLDSVGKLNFWRSKHMVLDGVSLLNLHILPALGSSKPNAAIADKDKEKSSSPPLLAFSLFNTVNRCQTAFGKRLLRQWISAPSCCPDVLGGRQAAIRWLMGEGMRPHTVRWAELLRKVPDLERLFQRIHTNGLKYRADPLHGHPDARAQLFEADKYNRRKIRDLLIVLDGLADVQRLVSMFTGVNEQSEEKAPALLAQCLGLDIEAMAEDLHFFKKAFDRESALKMGVILPHRGVDRVYDEACRAVDDAKARLDAYLSGVKKRLRCSKIKFFGTGRNAYQLEIPDSHCGSLADEFTFTSQRKGFNRYSTEQLQRLVAELAEAECRCAAISAEVTRRVFADFDARKDKWSAIVHHVGTFDCLLALTLYAQGCSQRMCFPEFVFDSSEPFLSIERGFHPMMINNTKSTADQQQQQPAVDYIPNGCQLGGGGEKAARTILLTGPNMGGKSTYMRQVASLTVLAQIGSMVPADSMRLTPVDRIFCRIGASDRLSAGQSTFYVELSETNTILRQATSHSLVLIDELGRGTSTYDGTAIACAVLKRIVGRIRCRMLFSTHYHALCTLVANNPDIHFAHMACMVENADFEEDPTMKSITFLYTLADGMCDKSYGFYTAKMAGLNVELVRRAFEASSLLEKRAAVSCGGAEVGQIA